MVNSDTYKQKKQGKFNSNTKIRTIFFFQLWILAILNYGKNSIRCVQKKFLKESLALVILSIGKAFLTLR